jgi:ABC-type transporter Mla MlaB component
VVREVAKGFLGIEKSDNKMTLKLRGDFDGDNIRCIEEVMVINKSFQNELLELDMSEVKSIDMQAMSLITINLKGLSERGISTSVAGLNGANLSLAKEMGMQFITQIK